MHSYMIISILAKKTKNILKKSSQQKHSNPFFAK